MIDRLLSISAYNQQETRSERRVGYPELIEIFLLLFLRVDNRNRNQTNPRSFFLRNDQIFF